MGELRIKTAFSSVKVVTGGILFAATKSAIADLVNGPSER